MAVLKAICHTFTETEMYEQSVDSQLPFNSHIGPVLHFHVSIQVAPCGLHLAADITGGAALVEGRVVLQAVMRRKHLATRWTLEGFLLLES